MENEIIYIDKVGLTDFVAFHEAESDIIDGYYYNSGRKDKTNNVIKNLYDLRLKWKNDQNPAQVVINLLMNSMYGKTIIKPIETDTTIKGSRDDFGNVRHLIIIILVVCKKLMGDIILKQLNPLCLIFIMFTLGLEIYPCL